jgi:DNA-binding NtrC family response regulator
VPPLADRSEDIPDLVRLFLARCCAEEGKRIRAITPDALKMLRAYAWPGNVRQLENAVFRAVVLADADEIGIGEFPQIEAQLAAQRQMAESVNGAIAEQQMPQAFAGELASLGRPSLPITIADAEPAIAAGALDLLNAHGDVRPLEEIENEIIRFAITHHRGQMSEIARRLRIGRSTLYRKLKELGFDGEANSEAENVASG